jgi:hypothetical protein
MNRKRIAVKIPHFEIEGIKELGHNHDIKNYLTNRGIWDAAQGIIKEVYYFAEDHKKLRKHFFAAGWQNENGGWEVRNKFYTGIIGTSGMNLIEGNQRHLAVFENFPDYLSWHHYHPDSVTTILVLNSLSLLVAAIRSSTYYPSIEIYFSNHPAGRHATAVFLKALPYAKNYSAIYEGYRNYFEKRKTEARGIEPPARPNIFAGIKVDFIR